MKSKIIYFTHILWDKNFFLLLDDCYIYFWIRKKYKFMIYTNYYNSPIGRITMASEGTALIGLWFEGQKYFADSIKEECTEKDLDIFDDTKIEKEILKILEELANNIFVI